MAPGADEPAVYWLSDLLETTPITELVRLAEIRLRAGHDYRHLKPASAWTTRGLLIHRLAPPRHPRRPRPGLLHHAQDGPKSPCAGMSLYQVLLKLQTAAFART